MTKGKKHIYWFAHYGPTCPSFRYRAKYPLEHLKEHSGIGYCLYNPERSLKGIISLIFCFVSALFSKPSSNLIVFQKICTRGPYAMLMKVLVRLKSNTLLDLDDAEYLWKDDRTLKYLIQHSSRCTVGSDALHEYCSILNGNIFKPTSPVKDHDVVRVKARRGLASVMFHNPIAFIEEDNK